MANEVSTKNERDGQPANLLAPPDSLLNYETVKYFNNERHEAVRFDELFAAFEDASVLSKTPYHSLTWVKFIIAFGLTAVMA